MIIDIVSKEKHCDSQSSFWLYGNQCIFGLGIANDNHVQMFDTKKNNDKKIIFKKIIFADNF